MKRQELIRRLQNVKDSRLRLAQLAHKLHNGSFSCIRFQDDSYPNAVYFGEGDEEISAAYEEKIRSCLAAFVEGRNIELLREECIITRELEKQNETE